MVMLDPDQVAEILKSHVAIMASTKEIRKEDQETYKEVTDDIVKLAKSLNNRTLGVLNERITEILNFKFFGTTLDLVADAPRFKIETLLRLKNFFNKAFIKTPNRITLLLKLAWEYYTYWWDCWWEHRNLDRVTFRKMQEATYAYANAASDTIGNFVSSTVEPYEQRLKREQAETERKAEEEKKKTEEETKKAGSWRTNMLGGSTTK